MAFMEQPRTDPRALLASLTLQDRSALAAGPLLVAGLLALPLAALVHALLSPSHRWAGFALGLGVLACLPLAAPQAVRALGARAPA